MKKISDRTHQLLEQLEESIIQDLDLNKELIRDCFPLKKEFSNQAGIALLTVETHVKKVLNLQPSHTGIAIIEDCQRMGLFHRSVASEEQGIELLFRGSVLGLRNILHHNKPKMKKEEVIKIILFADYLIKLFEYQRKLNRVRPLRRRNS
jgi:hypothetical protein